MTHNEVIKFLTDAPDEEMLAILAKVFQSKHPGDPQSEHYRSRYFLGTASSNRESDESGKEQWEPWEIHAVAYIDYDEYDDEWGFGPDYGFCQFGTCMGCGTRACSNSKNGICSICGTKVYLT